MVIRTLAFAGLELRDKLLLKSMAERAARRQGQVWQLAEANVADCVISQGEPPVKVRADAVRVCLGSAPRSAAVRVLQYPPRLGEIAQLLADVDRRLNSGAAAVTGRGTSTWHQLAEQLQQRIAQGQPTALVDSAGNGWTIHPAERQYTATGPTEVAPDHLRAIPAGQWQLTDPAPAGGRPRRALEALLWHLGIVAGGEGVLASVGEDRQLRMRVWPYLLARAPKRFGEFAALLRQGQRSARELRAACEAPTEEIAAFVNACLLCGFVAPAVEGPAIRPAARAAAAHTIVPRQTQGFTRFLGAIRHALGMPA